VTKIPDVNNLREERFILIIVSVHYGGEDMVEQPTSWWTGCKAEQ
jgi:hypothetical protein